MLESFDETSTQCWEWTAQDTLARRQNLSHWLTNLHSDCVNIAKCYNSLMQSQDACRKVLKNYQNLQPKSCPKSDISSREYPSVSHSTRIDELIQSTREVYEEIAKINAQQKDSMTAHLEHYKQFKHMLSNFQREWSTRFNEIGLEDRGSAIDEDFRAGFGGKSMDQLEFQSWEAFIALSYATGRSQDVNEGFDTAIKENSRLRQGLKFEISRRIPPWMYCRIRLETKLAEVEKAIVDAVLVSQNNYIEASIAQLDKMELNSLKLNSLRNSFAEADFPKNHELAIPWRESLVKNDLTHCNGVQNSPGDYTQYLLKLGALHRDAFEAQFGKFKLDAQNKETETSREITYNKREKYQADLRYYKGQIKRLEDLHAYKARKEQALQKKIRLEQGALSKKIGHVIKRTQVRKQHIQIMQTESSKVAEQIYQEKQLQEQQRQKLQEIRERKADKERSLKLVQGYLSTD